MAPVAPQAEDPEQIEQIKLYAPSGIKTLRACLRCRLIMTKEQFLQHGCPYCKDVLHMQDDEGRVLACTTTNYQGFIASIRPGAFVSRFNGLDGRLPGCYALTVQGSIPDYILHESEYERDSEAGVKPGTGNRATKAPTPGARSPSLHLTEDSEAENASEEAVPKSQTGEAGQPSSPAGGATSPASRANAAPTSPVEGLFSPEPAAAVDEVLKGLFSPTPASPEAGEDAPEKKRRRLGESPDRSPAPSPSPAPPNILEPEADTEFAAPPGGGA